MQTTSLGPLTVSRIALGAMLMGDKTPVDEAHLSNAYRKLDIRSRTQLPEALAGRERTPAEAQAT